MSHSVTHNHEETRRITKRSLLQTQLRFLIKWPSIFRRRHCREGEKRFPVVADRAKRARRSWCAPYLIVHPRWLRWAFNQPVSLSGHCSNARTIRSFSPHYNALDTPIDDRHAWEVNHSACIFETTSKPSSTNMPGASIVARTNVSSGFFCLRASARCS